jgi:hypothetical protein
MQYNAFSSLSFIQSSALQHITQDILTHNAELIRQGRTEINTALLNHNTALATCIGGGGAASSTATTP